MSQELELNIALIYNPEFHENNVSEAELSLLSSILPELLKEMAIQLELEKE
jgi:hypothetical protein